MKCPGCKAELQQSGEVTFDGATLAVYQCDTCIVHFDFGSRVFPAALTFAVDAAGRVLDAGRLEPLDLARVRAAGFSDN